MILIKEVLWNSDLAQLKKTHYHQDGVKINSFNVFEYTVRNKEGEEKTKKVWKLLTYSEGGLILDEILFESTQVIFEELEGVDEVVPVDPPEGKNFHEQIQFTSKNLCLKF